ncbi:hypothetical protein [Halorussus sp. AFM4]|uniref:hypothetical protein n=1 Tax=Halorussus sp. AFM4 TaxID=3421651 RepID=UPI003EB82AC7
MVEAEILINSLTLLIVLVVLTFVGVAYYRTRIQRLLVLFLLAALLGINMVVTLAEDFLEQGIPYIEVLSSLFGLGIALLLLLTIVRRFTWEPE